MSVLKQSNLIGRGPRAGLPIPGTPPMAHRFRTSRCTPAGRFRQPCGSHERFGGIDIEACFQLSTVDEQDVHAAAQAVRLFPSTNA
jgi:hypothetical protein